jgi:hypothetical protein
MRKSRSRQILNAFNKLLHFLKFPALQVLINVCRHPQHLIKLYSFRNAFVHVNSVADADLIKDAQYGSLSGYDEWPETAVDSVNTRTYTKLGIFCVC